MAITRLTSKKYGYTYQVDFRFKDPFGVTQRHIKSGFKTKKEAKNYEAVIREKANAKILIPENSNRTINDTYDEYIQIEGNLKYANATKVFYNAIFDCYLKNTFGKSVLASINYVAIQQFLNDASKIYNYPTVFNMKRMLNVVFKYAIRAGYVSKNPMENVLVPNKPIERKKTEIINDDDLKKVIEEILRVPANGRWGKENTAFCCKAQAMAIVIGRYTGLRISEVLGLKKSDFDLDKNQLSVQRRLDYAKLNRSGMHLTNSLKTRSSKSRVEISQRLSEYLKQWFEYNPNELVICHLDGSLFHPAALQDSIRRAGKKVGVKLHFHMLRHTYATELMMAGINPIVVKDLLRHSKVNTTWDVYTHPKREDQREALDSLYMDFE